MHETHHNDQMDKDTREAFIACRNILFDPVQNGVMERRKTKPTDLSPTRIGKTEWKLVWFKDHNEEWIQCIVTTGDRSTHPIFKKAKANGFKSYGFDENLFPDFWAIRDNRKFVALPVVKELLKNNEGKDLLQGKAGVEHSVPKHLLSTVKSILRIFFKDNSDFNINIIKNHITEKV